MKDRSFRRQDWRAGLAPERVTIGDSRAWVCSRATGHVLEVCAGTGLNLQYYPEGVQLTAVDLDAELLGVARDRVGPRPHVSLLRGDAARLPFADEGFDSVVCTLALCEFDDRLAVLTEMHRVLRPGGRLLLLDHAQWRWLRQVRPAALALEVGFVTQRHERLRMGLIERVDARKPTA